MPFFGAGHLYSARADYERFITVDRHLSSYVGIIGVGVISGWIPVPTTGLSVSIGQGTGIINGYFSESGWNIIPHTSVLPGDVIIEASYYTSPSGVVYDKILVSASVTLPNDSECYLYAYRNSNYIQEVPFLLPDNENPVPETSSTLNPSHSAVAFSYASSLRQASSSGRVLIGLVITRSGTVSFVDTSSVAYLGDMDAPIKDFARYILHGHRHGGSNYYDPQPIRLDVDRRSMVLTSSYDARYEFTAINSDHTSESEGHDHTYWVDDDGNGITVAVYGNGPFHYHIVTSAIVGDPVSDVEVVGHIHDISLRNGNNDGWDQSDAVQIYVNGKEYTDTDFSIDALAKTVTFTGGVTVKAREYTISSGDWVFTSEEGSLYRFMLRAAIAYYTAYPDSTNIILPDVATPVSELKTQAMVGEYRLVHEGDTFKFVLPAASDIVVTLSSEAHVDVVEVEVLTNSEVQGRLPQDNILYIPASKIAAGKFDPERIPVIDHMGRFAEIAEPIPSLLQSYDGMIYQIPSSGMATDARSVYHVCDDGLGNVLVSTSDGLWMIPSGGAYLFSVNGVQVKTNPGDIYSALSEAVTTYGRETGIAVDINSAYSKQIAEATMMVSAPGDTYLFVGLRNPAVPGGVDRILLRYVSTYKLTKYGYTAIRTASDIKPGEVVVAEIPQEKEEGSEEEPETFYRVVNDFSRYAVKDISLQRNVPSGYASSANRYFAVSSSGVFWSDDADVKWESIDESSISGYVYAMKRAPSGLAALSSDSGFYVSLHGSARGFRKVARPVSGKRSSFIEILPNGMIVAFSDEYSSISSDYGKTWVSTILPSKVVSVSIDRSLDATSIVSGHSHSISVDGDLNGWTSHDAGHSHDVVGGVIQEYLGHSHEFDRTITVFCSNGSVARSVNAVSWAALTTVEKPRSSWTTVFAAFGKLYVSTVDIVSVFSLGVWSDSRSFPPMAVSSTPSYDGFSVHVGYDNSFGSFDGSEYTQTMLFGVGQPSSFTVDYIPSRINTYVSYPGSSVDFGGDIHLGSNVYGVYDRSSYRPEQGGWKDGIGYDLYIADRLVLSTRSGIDRRTGYVEVDNAGYIIFSVSGKTASDLQVGDTTLTVELSLLSNLPASGRLRLMWVDGTITKTVFLSYSSKSNSSVTLDEMSAYYVPSQADVDLVPQVMSSDDVRITVYDGKLTNVGVLVHEEVEDALSTKNTGLGWRMSDVYLANLMHLSVAADYMFPGVASNFIDTFLTRFNYNDIPGDPMNIDRYIDRNAGDMASLAIYDVDGPRAGSSRLSTILPGFGIFSNMCFSASDSGLYVLDFVSLESNWIRVPEFEKVYDVLQFDATTLYVASSTGLYKTTDVNLVLWSEVSVNSVGGIPTVIAARWGAIRSDDGTSYWWNKWDGVVNPSNPSFVNTLIVSGDGFLSYSDDKGVSWLKGSLYSTSDKLSDMTVVSYGLLMNGSIAACAKSADGNRSGVYVCTGTGNRWNELFSSVSLTGNILSMSITDALNVSVAVDFNLGPPPDGSLVGRMMAVGGSEARVVSNSGSTIVVFGESMMSSSGGTFTVLPYRMNCIREDRQRRIHVGTSDGLKWDSGGTFSYDRRRDGRISAIGNAAVIESVGISGVVEYVVPSPGLSSSYRLSAKLSKAVVVNEVVEWKISFIASIPPLTVVSNSASKPDGTVDMVVSGDASSAVNGYGFRLSGSGIRLYVDYVGTMQPSLLNGGSLVVEPQESEYGLPRSDIAVYKIVKNTANFIELSSEVVAPEGYDTISTLRVGATVYCTNSVGNIPIVVDFDSQRQVNELSGNQLSFNGVDSIPDGGKLQIVSNDETIISVRESYEAIGVDGELTSYSVFNTLYSGIDFSLSIVPLSSIPSFSNVFSSWNNGHRHQVTPISGPIIGDITAIPSSTSFEVELLLSGAWQLVDPWLSSETDLFTGFWLTAYDPKQPLVRYRLRVVRHSSSSIFVAREDGKIDISGNDGNKVGVGFRIHLSTVGFGKTVAMEYDSKFISSNSLLSYDALKGANELELVSVFGVVVGCKLEVVSNRTSFLSEVVSVSGSIVGLSSPLPCDFTIDNGSYARAYYFEYEAGSTTVTSGIAYGDTLVGVSDSSMASSGDVMKIDCTDGLSYKFDVLAVFPGIIQVPPSTQVISAPSVSNVVFIRKNAEWSHTHSIKAGEFSIVSSESRDAVGDSLTHGHYLSPLIEEVNGIGFVGGMEYAVGSGHRIYSSFDNGDTWTEAIDLEDSKQYNPLPSYLGGVYVLSSSEVAFSTSSGYYVYQSDKYSRQIGSSSVSSSLSSSSSSLSSSSSFSSSSSSSSNSEEPWDILDGGLPTSVLEDVFDGGFPDTVIWDIEIDGGNP